MKLTFVRNVMVAGAFLVASAAHAATIEQLFLADLTGNNAAEINVDEAGNVTCTAVIGFTDACGGLTLPAGGTITPHGTLRVFGDIGQFSIDVTGHGGVTTVYPSLETLTQANVNNKSGASGDFVTEFTDSQYCIDFPSCFGSMFRVAVGQTPDSQINGSTTDNQAWMSNFNTIPADVAITPLIHLTGNNNNGLGGQVFINPGGSSGSLSASTSTHFTGKGEVQTTFTISTLTPEPSTFALFGIAAGFLGLKLRRRKA